MLKTGKRVKIQQMHNFVVSDICELSWWIKNNQRLLSMCDTLNLRKKASYLCIHVIVIVFEVPLYIRLQDCTNSFSIVKFIDLLINCYMPYCAYRTNVLSEGLLMYKL